jgi:transcriptional regulator with XRE-family HTH domain
LNFGELLRWYRKRIGMTQKELCGLLQEHVKGMQQSALSRMEKGKLLPCPFQMSRLTIELGIAGEELQLLQKKWQEARNAGVGVG